MYMSFFCVILEDIEESPKVIERHYDRESVRKYMKSKEEEKRRKKKEEKDTQEKAQNERERRLKVCICS